MKGNKLCNTFETDKIMLLILQTYETLTVNVFTRLFYFAIDRTLLIIDFTLKRTPFSYRPYTCQIK